MTTDPDARDRLNHTINEFRERPGTRCGAVVLTGRIEDGLLCTVDEGDAHAVVDMLPAFGGTAAGPAPGFYARSGIASCIGINVKMAALREGLDLSTVEVEIAMDFDYSAMFGVGDNTAGPFGTRITLRIETREDKGQVERLVEEALSRDPWLLSFTNAQAATVQTEIAKP